MSFELAVGLFYWLRLAGLSCLLVLAIFQARRRWANWEPDSQARRIIFPWLAILLGFSIYAGLLSVFLAPVVIFYIVAAVALWVAIPALVSIAVLDLGARLMKAERTGVWLGAGLAAHTAITLIWLAWLAEGEVRFVPDLWLEYLAILSIPVSAAISWWSYLPVGGGGAGSGVAETFD